MSVDETLRDLAGAGQDDLGPLLLRAHRKVNATLIERLVALGHETVRAAHAAVFTNLDPAGTRTVTLARRAGMTRQAMSQLVHELQDAGYVTVEPDPDDGRATLVRLTDRGIEFCRQAARLVRELDEHWRQRLGADDLAHLRAMLRTLGS
jgi:DNA-binding MarR family transcriptional regulator